MGEVRPLDMPTTQTIAMTLSSAKRVCKLPHHSPGAPTNSDKVCVSHALVAEIKRMVKESEIMKYV